MSDHPIDPDVLISLATAALTRAEADAAAPDTKLIFRSEWRPTPRTRNSTSHPPVAPGAARSFSWASFFKDQLSHLQQVQPLPSPGLPTKLTFPSASGSASTSAPRPRLPAVSAPELPLRPGRMLTPPPGLEENAVAKLLERNKDVFNEALNHPFPRALGEGTASLDGFRYYMIQDKLYLETCARLKMKAVAAAPNFKDVEAFDSRHKASLEYVKKLKETCVTMLGIPEDIMESTPRSVQLDTTEHFYKNTLRDEDALLAFVLICF
ncbi:hypothetical protein K438DRAFT_411856 [Mycena galopus ATCC 62051]|nr:hypothetical protein K438DRAFT_411856 [Mycena galopus ATCC 62051]